MSRFIAAAVATSSIARVAAFASSRLSDHESLRVIPVSFPGEPDELEVLQARMFSAEEVARIFQVPPHMLGITGEPVGRRGEMFARQFLVDPSWQRAMERTIKGRSPIVTTLEALQAGAG